MKDPSKAQKFHQNGQAATYSTDIGRWEQLRKVEQLQRSALAQPDLLRANLASLNAGLMGLGVQLQQTLKQRFQDSPPSMAELREVMPAINATLRVTQQIDRFTRLDLTIDSLQRAKTL